MTGNPFGFDELMEGIFLEMYKRMHSSGVNEYAYDGILPDGSGFSVTVRDEGNDNAANYSLDVRFRITPCPYLHTGSHMQIGIDGRTFDVNASIGVFFPRNSITKLSPLENLATVHNTICNIG